MKTYSVSFNQPGLAKIIGYLLSYLIRFIEAPYLLILATGILFTFLIMFGNSDGLINHIFSYLILAPVVGFKAALNPNIVYSGGTKDLVIMGGFWLLIYHLFWEVGYWITKKPFFQNGDVRTKSLSWLLVTVNLVFFISGTIDKRHEPDQILFLLIFLIIMTLAGLASLRISSMLRQTADLMITGNKQTDA